MCLSCTPMKATGSASRIAVRRGPAPLASRDFKHLGALKLQERDSEIGGSWLPPPTANKPGLDGMTKTAIRVSRCFDLRPPSVIEICRRLPSAEYSARCFSILGVFVEHTGWTSERGN